MRSLLLLFICQAITSGAAASPAEDILSQVAFEQKPGAVIPASLELRTSAGERVTFSEFADKPVILALTWFDCPNLCPVILNNLAEALQGTSLDRNDYHVVVVDIDAGAQQGKTERIRQSLRRGGSEVDNWHFLSGNAQTITRLSEAVGMAFAYEADSEQYAHPAGFVVLTAGATVNRYLLELSPSPRDLTLAVVESGQGKAGRLSDQVLLRCFRFDPTTGKYTLAVVNLLQVFGVAFLLVLFGSLWWMQKRGGCSKGVGHERR